MQSLRRILPNTRMTLNKNPGQNSRFSRKELLAKCLSMQNGHLVLHHWKSVVLAAVYPALGRLSQDGEVMDL